jgi:hypothetical protein
MSTHSHDDHNLHPEDSGIKPQPILMFLVILTISTAAVFVIIKGTMWGLAKMEEMNPQTPATLVNAGERKLPPEPRLQGAPGAGSTATKDVPTDLPLDEWVKGYGWVNKEAGVAHITIERAKDLIVEKGLPLREAGVAELEKAAETRKAVLNAGPNAGRMIKKP